VSEGGGAGIASQHKVEQLQTVEELNAKLVMVLQKRDRAFEQVLSFPVASVLFKCPNSQLSRKHNFSQQSTVNSQQPTIISLVQPELISLAERSKE